MQSRFFLAFDLDGDGLISYHEYLLIMVFLGVHVEARSQLLRLCRPLEQQGCLASRLASLQTPNSSLLCRPC